MKDTPDKLTAIYIKMRDAIRDKEDEIKEIKAQQEKVIEKMLALCEEQNIDSLRTPAGTISRRVRTNYWANDWDKMYNFIEEHAAFHLLEKRIHTSNMKEFLETNPDVAPPGLQVNRKYTVTVLKPRNT
jgi:enamine deaminase RidA (YjgF/YER057c/UK114 family)